MATTVIINQPMAPLGRTMIRGSIHGDRGWDSGLFGCFSDFCASASLVLLFTSYMGFWTDVVNYDLGPFFNIHFLWNVCLTSMWWLTTPSCYLHEFWIVIYDIRVGRVVLPRNTLGRAKLLHVEPLWQVHRRPTRIVTFYRMYPFLFCKLIMIKRIVHSFSFP